MFVCCCDQLCCCNRDEPFLYNNVSHFSIINIKCHTQALYTHYRIQNVFSLTNKIKADLDQFVEFVQNYDKFRTSNNIIFQKY